MGERVYADGGSATTQAKEKTEAWKPRPVASLLIRAVSLLAPVIGSFAMGRVYGLAITPDLFGEFAYWVGLLTLSIMTALAVEKEAQALLPMAALFKMSLVFPDRAPTRFSIALRQGTTKRLSARAHEFGEDAAAAELLALVKDLSRHDPLTRGHSERVRAYADIIAEELGISEAERHKLAWGALAHDIGKLEVRPETLNKPGRPNDEEWAEIRNHPAAATPLLADLEPWLGDWALAASQHHERFDGNGYPNGLKGHEISLAGRIVAVADAYDVMTSTRSYKKALSPEAAREELINSSETQFDPVVVRAFINVGLRRIKLAGPLAWLSELAWFARVPQAVSTVGSTTVTTVATAAVAVGTAVTAGSVEPPEPPEVAAIERTVDEFDPMPSVDAGDVDQDAPLLLAPGVVPTPPAGSESDSTLDNGAVPTPPAVDRGEATTTIAPATTTTAAPVASTTTAPAATLVPQPTTTLAPVTTTTLAPVTPTTVAPVASPAPTTTTTIQPAPSGAAGGPPGSQPPPPRELNEPILLGGASGSNHHRLPLEGSLLIGGEDDGPSLVLDRRSTLDEARSDDHAHAHFQMSADDGLVLDGDTALTIWVAAADFDQTATAGVHVELSDCASPTSLCIPFAESTIQFDQADFGTGFGQVDIDFGDVTRSIAPSRYLVMEIHADPAGDTNVWLGFGTTAFPASFHIG